MIAEERKWAEGMNETDFQAEYGKRFPHAGSCPTVMKYLSWTPPDYRTIDSRIEHEIEETPKVEKVDEYVCRGCGRTWDADPLKRKRLGYFSHMRHCKELMKLKV